MAASSVLVADASLSAIALSSAGGTAPASLCGLTSKEDSFWLQAQAALRERMSQPSFETWISPLALESIGERSVTLRAESEFSREQILKRYRGDLQAALSDALGRPVDVNVIVAEPDEVVGSGEGEPPLPTGGGSADASARPWTPRTTTSNLNPRYTFEAFVVGQHNRFCHAAALAVAESPAQSYNPFFIYGGVGLGKTHLMQAIGHFALQHHQDLRVRYVTAEQFTNDMINALGRKDMKGFQDRYRRNDILIIDDVQFLEGKVRTQEEVFHTFNALHGSGKQIILSSDRSPRHLSNLEDRLRSRFEWGLIADIQPADYETRLAILCAKVERENLRVPTDVLSFIAEANPNNIRELEGALNKIAAYGMLTRTPIDLTIAQTVLGTPVDQSRLSLEDVLEAAAGYYHLRPVDLKSPSRAKDISHARQVAIYVIRTVTEASFPKIGELLGGRKHTTILYGYEKVREELETRPVLRQQIEEIKLRIQKK
jgi:chromosomal replication initiator protein